jgi:hypothetical protein
VHLLSFPMIIYSEVTSLESGDPRKYPILEGPWSDCHSLPESDEYLHCNHGGHFEILHTEVC